jgi:hypothetical protein
MYREMRDVDKEMQGFRRATARRDKASPRTIAEEIWEEFDTSELRTSPLAFIPNNEVVDPIKLPSGKPRMIDDLFERSAIQVDGQVLKLGSRPKAEFAAKLTELGLYGDVLIPRSDKTCQKALESFNRYEGQMEAKFRELAEERSADAEAQSRIVRELWKLFRASAHQNHPAPLIN